MNPDLDNEEKALRSVAMQNAAAILLARQRAEKELSSAKASLEQKTAELARTVSVLREETHALELLNQTGAILTSELDPDALIQSITDAATRISGAEFGAFFYTRTDEAGDKLMLFALSGAPREAFEKFGQPRATALFGPTFNGDGPIRCDDVLQDPLYGKMSPHHGMPPGHLAVRSYLAVPVKSRVGKVFGGLFFGHPEPGIFSDRTERLIVGIATQAAVAIDNARLYEDAQKSAEEREKLLISERNSRENAERASAMKDDFLATLSHELRTPLNAILGWAEILRHGIRSTADLHKGLETIERNARAQSQLIDDLLDMNSIASGKVRLDMQRLQPFSFIEAAIETVRPAAEAKGIRIQRMLDPSAGPISGDPNRLQQVMWNLLSNAIKFTPRGGKVQVLLERVNSQIEISVAADFMPYVFDRFRQADGSTTRRYGGLGLGLTITKNLVELHGGIVCANSPGTNRGAAFSVFLPITIASIHNENESRAHPKTPQDLPPKFSPVDLSGVNVLVVDDERDARDLMRRILAECNANVYTAGNGGEALALVEMHRPHILVTDIGMPDVDGFELLRRVRALGAAKGGAVAAIALTAFARSEDRTKALRAGFSVHVSKPVEPSELIATVASVAGRIGVE